MWGWPGSSGLETHMSFGPKRVENGRLVDNQLTLLTVSDLVFIDPVGTGFSRPSSESRTSSQRARRPGVVR
jgi:carboxypeptidase C (cathepsin A)